MNQDEPRFTYQEVIHPPYQVGEWTVTPVVRAAAIRLPFGGLVWNRPTAVIMQQRDNPIRLAIPDVTRYAQIGAMAAGAGLALLFWWLVKR